MTGSAQTRVINRQRGSWPRRAQQLLLRLARLCLARVLDRNRRRVRLDRDRLRPRCHRFRKEKPRQVLLNLRAAQVQSANRQNRQVVKYINYTLHL